MPTGWTPPLVEDAIELPWEQNPYFVPALEAVGITTVGADASKAYPNPPDDQFGIGAATPGRRTPLASPSSTAPPRLRPGTRSTSSTTPQPTPRNSTSTTRSTAPLLPTRSAEHR